MADTPNRAGCVVYRRDAYGVHYLLVLSSGKKDWVLPKGHIEDDGGESLWVAAKRELAEEAGVRIKEENEDESEKLPLHRFVPETGPEVVVQYFLVEEAGPTESTENRPQLWVSEAGIPYVQVIEDIRDVLEEAASLRKRREEAR